MKRANPYFTMRRDGIFTVIDTTKYEKFMCNSFSNRNTKTYIQKLKRRICWFKDYKRINHFRMFKQWNGKK